MDKLIFFNSVRIFQTDDWVSATNNLLHQSDRLLIVTTRGTVSRLGLEAGPFECDTSSLFSSVNPNPDIEDLEDQTKTLSGNNYSKVLAIGGGSAIDTAKVFSVGLANYEANVLAKMLADSSNSKIKKRLPVIAIPTTAGTGAEVTPFATVWDMKNKKKYSLADDKLLPDSAIINPLLTCSMSGDQTLFTALDAISHALESIWNKNRTDVSVSLSLRALKLMVDYLPAVLKRPRDLEARGNVQIASVLAGMSISQTRTSLAHAVSYPLTYNFQVPHGLACSFMLLEMMELHESELRNSGMSSKDFDRLRKMLLDFDLKAMLAVYLSGEELEALVEDMMSNPRIDNYSGNLSRALVTELVSK